MSVLVTPGVLRKREEARVMIEQFGYKAEQVPGGYLITGPKTRFRVADLAYVLESDLR